LLARTWDRLQLSTEELGIDPAAIPSLAWVRAGVAQLRPTRLGYELEIGPYAGRLSLGTRQIEVQELVAGTVAACLALSTSGRRIGQQESAVGRPIPPSTAVAIDFTRALLAAIRKGIKKEYVDVRLTTSRPRAKLLVAESIKGPWARGHQTSVVTRTRPLSEDTVTNRALLAAGIRAQHLLRDHPETLHDLRECLIALSGATLVPSPRMPLDNAGPESDIAAALASAANLIEGVPVMPTEGPPTSAFSAWVNVERVFEEAVLAICSRIHPSSTSVGRTLQVPLFTSLKDEPDAITKRADPDVVVRNGDRTFVLDAKYRRSGERPTEEELYQLIAHAQAFNADAAALVAPAIFGAPGTRWLGRIRGGCSVEVIAIDPRQGAMTERQIRDWFTSRAAA
jgi:hypothetical protein